MTLHSLRFRNAIKAIHREKDAVYRDAWKKRGEVLSILANIARKVDRIEYAVDRGLVTKDESSLDTAVDLFIYCLQYETFLADLDPVVAKKLFDGSKIERYSEGTAGLEYLLDISNLDEIGTGGPTVAEAVSNVVGRFAKLESCFTGVNAQCPVAFRLSGTEALLSATITLLSALKRQDNTSYDNFILSKTREVDE